MNSDTQMLIMEIFERTGAIENCQICFGCMLDTEDGDAKNKAYGMATNAWKNSDRGFRGMTREEVVEQLDRTLARIPSSCPRCNKI